MTLRRTCIFAVLLCAASYCSAQTGYAVTLTPSEYRAELDRLLATTKQLDSSGNSLPSELKEVPYSWRVHTDQQDFEIPAAGLRQDIRSFEQASSADTALAIRSRLQNLRNDIDGFEAPPADVSTQRQHLAAVLARPEFRSVHGPTFLERLQQKLLAIFVRALESIFGSAFSTVSNFFVYGLIALALWALGFVAYRQISAMGESQAPLPSSLPVSAKAWSIWLAEARAAATQKNWREAIHLAYWGGISFLEAEGAWRPDRARTPREYLRLLTSSPERRENLASLTRVFELAWYAKREADHETFLQTLQALEKLGCRSL